MEAGDLILNPIIREAGRRSFQLLRGDTHRRCRARQRRRSVGAAMLARDTAQSVG